MMLCKYCDYYKSFNDSSEIYTDDNHASCKKGICTYTSFIFRDDPEDIKIEYPCNTKINNFISKIP